MIGVGMVRGDSPARGVRQDERSDGGVADRRGGEGREHGRRPRRGRASAVTERWAARAIGGATELSRALPPMTVRSSRVGWMTSTGVAPSRSRRTSRCSVHACIARAARAGSGRRTVPNAAGTADIGEIDDDEVEAQPGDQIHVGGGEGAAVEVVVVPDVDGLEVARHRRRRLDRRAQVGVGDVVTTEHRLPSRARVVQIHVGSVGPPLTEPARIRSPRNVVGTRPHGSNPLSRPGRMGPGARKVDSARNGAVGRNRSRGPNPGWSGSGDALAGARGRPRASGRAGRGPGPAAGGRRARCRGGGWRRRPTPPRCPRSGPRRGRPNRSPRPAPPVRPAW